jgi:hypothetical protein
MDADMRMDIEFSIWIDRTSTGAASQGLRELNQRPQRDDNRATDGSISLQPPLCTT